MKVRCRVNTVGAIELDSCRARLMRSIRLEDGDGDLQIGKDYVVHAIERRDNGLWFYVQSVPANDYPIPYPAEFFDLVDSRIEANWEVNIALERETLVIRRLSFKEWSHDDSFFERLVDGESNAQSIYRDCLLREEDK